MFFITYPFKGQVHVFAGQVKIVTTGPAGQVQYWNIFVPCNIFGKLYSVTPENT